PPGRGPSCGRSWALRPFLSRSVGSVQRGRHGRCADSVRCQRIAARSRGRCRGSDAEMPAADRSTSLEGRVCGPGGGGAAARAESGRSTNGWGARSTRGESSAPPTSGGAVGWSALVTVVGRLLDLEVAGEAGVVVPGHVVVPFRRLHLADDEVVAGLR